MRCALLLLALMCFSIERAPAESAPVAVTAWFTQAAITDSVQAPKPVEPLKEATGTSGSGVILDKPVSVENPIFNRQNGLISFWIKPNWNGNDGKRHVLLKIGDPARNGLIIEKAASGMLRYVMATPAKTTASRADVSSWKAGEWHQIAVLWRSANGKAVGMPLWIDKKCVDGPIFGANEFMNPSDTRVFIGDRTSEAVMDELIIRTKLDTESPYGAVGTIYRDFFRTAPYTKTAIDLRPHYGPMDTRIVLGCEKQFGLLAERASKMEKVTDFAARYANWSNFDARPFIKWTTSDSKIATVNENGRVTGKALGKCRLTAEFRGMKSSYALQVIPIEQPDLDLVYVERLPRYQCDAAKNNPAPGDEVQSVARIINFGYKPAPAGAVVTFQLIPDENRNYRLDADEKAIFTQTQVINTELKPREEFSADFKWTWTDKPTWVRVTVDPKGKFSEICDANNEICDLNIARPMHMAVTVKQLEDFYKNRKINHIGSFSEYDWTQGQMARFNVMMRDAVFATTSAEGVRESFRIDNIYLMNPDTKKWDDEPYVTEAGLYDGGFPVNEPIDLMAVDAAILHEYGHCCAAIPDLYGYGVNKQNVLLRDRANRPYAGSDLMPCINENGSLMPLSSANSVPCGGSYGYLMDGCQLNLSPFHAGQIQWLAGDYRGNRFWAIQDHFIPQFENYLRIYDINDNPLKGAAVYVYAVINAPVQDAGAKYFADRPKFIGNTDNEGGFRFPNETDASWDDADTDSVEGTMYVENPFARVNRNINWTPNVWCVEGLLLVKIVSGDQTEFFWLPLTEFNRIFFEGNKAAGTIAVRTSLLPSADVTPVVTPQVPEAISKVNKMPVAEVPAEITVRCKEEFTIDGSKSYDPEGQPLLYRWSGYGKDFDGPIFSAKAPDQPTEFEIRFYVIDGLRTSEAKFIKVKVAQ